MIVDAYTVFAALFTSGAVCQEQDSKAYEVRESTMYLLQTGSPHIP
jgi:hypothetical protein